MYVLTSALLQTSSLHLSCKIYFKNVKLTGQLQSLIVDLHDLLSGVEKSGFSRFL